MRALMGMIPLMLVGCSSVKGEIAGDNPDSVRSSYWYTVGSDDNQVIASALVSFPDGCKTAAAYTSAQANAYTAFADSGDPDALVSDLTASEQDNLPSEFWQYNLTITQDPDDTVEGSYSLEKKEALLGVAHQMDYTDYEKVKIDLDTSGFHIQTYVGSAGTVEIKKFKNEGTLSGKADASLLDTDQKDAGAIELTLSVPYCEEMTSAYADFIAALAGFGS